MPDPLAQAVSLDGWKEIAAYLRRSVRSAQRWERTLGLPVHRMVTPEGGRVVYAQRHEIDAWRRRHDARQVTDAPKRSRRPSASLLLLTVVNVAAAAYTVFVRAARPD